MASSSPNTYRGVIPPLRASRSSTSVDPTRERFDALLPKYGFMWRSMANAKLSNKPISQAAVANKENSSPNKRNAAIKKSKNKKDEATAEVPSLLGAILNKKAVSLSVPSQDHELCGDDCNCADPILEIDDDDDEKDGVFDASSVNLDEAQSGQHSDDDSVQLVSTRKETRKQAFILESDDDEDDFEMNESSVSSERNDADVAPKRRKLAAFDDLSDFNPSSGDESDESFISSERNTPIVTRRNPTRRTAAALTFPSQSDFISDSEDDDDKSTSSEEEWDEQVSLEEKDQKEPRTRRVNRVIILSDDEEYDSESDLEEEDQSAFTISDDDEDCIPDSDDSVAQSFVEDKTRKRSPPIRNATKSPRIPRKKKAATKQTPEAPSSKPRVVNFTKHRDNLTSEAFAEFNRLAFANQLSSVNVTWSKKLNTTAGVTRMRGKLGEKHSNSRVATIELATKVIENEEQLRSTLLHEMCHAAAWLVDGVVKPPHGKVFKQWASKSMKKINDVVVTTTHDYQITYKFAWACTNKKCNVVIKRHSRSVDINKHCCGKCKSKLIEIEVPKKGEDISNNAFTPKKQRKTSEYALFVKKHSGSIRDKLAKERLCSPKEVSQADVMKECGAEWQRRKHDSSTNPISEMVNLTLD